MSDTQRIIESPNNIRSTNHLTVSSVFAMIDEAQNTTGVLIEKVQQGGVEKIAEQHVSINPLHTMLLMVVELNILHSLVGASELPQDAASYLKKKSFTYSNQLYEDVSDHEEERLRPFLQWLRYFHNIIGHVKDGIPLLEDDKLEFLKKHARPMHNITQILTLFPKSHSSYLVFSWLREHVDGDFGRKNTVLYQRLVNEIEEAIQDDKVSRITDTSSIQTLIECLPFLGGLTSQKFKLLCKHLEDHGIEIYKNAPFEAYFIEKRSERENIQVTAPSRVTTYGKNLTITIVEPKRGGEYIAEPLPLLPRASKITDNDSSQQRAEDKGEVVSRMSFASFSTIAFHWNSSPQFRELFEKINKDERLLLVYQDIFSILKSSFAEHEPSQLYQSLRKISIQANQGVIVEDVKREDIICYCRILIVVYEIIIEPHFVEIDVIADLKTALGYFNKDPEYADLVYDNVSELSCLITVESNGSLVCANLLWMTHEILGRSEIKGFFAEAQSIAENKREKIEAAKAEKVGELTRRIELLRHEYEALEVSSDILDGIVVIRRYQSAILDLVEKFRTKKYLGSKEIIDTKEGRLSLAEKLRKAFEPIEYHIQFLIVYIQQQTRKFPQSALLKQCYAEAVQFGVESVLIKQKMYQMYLCVPSKESFGVFFSDITSRTVLLSTKIVRGLSYGCVEDHFSKALPAWKRKDSYNRIQSNKEDRQELFNNIRLEFKMYRDLVDEGLIEPHEIIHNISIKWIHHIQGNMSLSYHIGGGEEVSKVECIKRIVELEQCILHQYIFDGDESVSTSDVRDVQQVQYLLRYWSALKRSAYKSSVLEEFIATTESIFLSHNLEEILGDCFAQYSYDIGQQDNVQTVTKDLKISFKTDKLFTTEVVDRILGIIIERVLPQAKPLRVSLKNDINHLAINYQKYLRVYQQLDSQFFGMFSAFHNDPISFKDYVLKMKTVPHDLKNNIAWYAIEKTFETHTLSDEIFLLVATCIFDYQVAHTLVQFNRHSGNLLEAEASALKILKNADDIPEIFEAQERPLEGVYIDGLLRLRLREEAIHLKTQGQYEESIGVDAIVVMLESKDSPQKNRYLSLTLLEAKRQEVISNAVPSVSVGYYSYVNNLYYIISQYAEDADHALYDQGVAERNIGMILEFLNHCKHMENNRSNWVFIDKVVHLKHLSRYKSDRDCLKLICDDVIKHGVLMNLEDQDLKDIVGCMKYMLAMVVDYTTLKKLKQNSAGNKVEFTRSVTDHLLENYSIHIIHASIASLAQICMYSVLQ